MKNLMLVTVVVLAHVVAIGGIAMMQGCGTPVGGSRIEPVNEVTMPPLEPLEPPAETRPVRIRPATTMSIPPARTVETTTYVVRKGDTLSGIAHRFGLSVAEVVALNQLDNKNLIRVGQSLLLPGKIDVQAPTPPQRPASSGSMARTASGNYVIQKGDTLSEIAVKFDTTVGAIRSANKLSGNTIYAGQKLVIPGAGDNAQATPSAASGGGTTEPASAEVQALEPEADSEPIVDMPATKPATPTTEKPATAETKPAETGNYRIYVVGEDEDLYTVGLLWNTSVEKIKELNNLTDTKLQPGQRLKIPYSE